MAASLMLMWSLAMIPAFQGATAPPAKTRSTEVPLAEALLLKGNYAEALEMLDHAEKARAAAKPPKSEPADIGILRSRCLSATGDYAGAEATLKAAMARHPKDSRLLAEMGEMDFIAGRWASARSAADKSIQLDTKNIAGRWLQARCMSKVGEFENANKSLMWFIDHYNAAQPTDAESLFLIARASIEYAVRNERHEELDFVLNEMLPDALKAQPEYWPAKWLTGTLLVDKYNKTQGMPDLKAALALNPQAVDTLVSLGESSLQDYDFSAGHSFADRALAVNAKSTSALLLKSDLLLADNRASDAEAFLKRATEINPNSEGTLGRWAALHLLGRRPNEAALLESKAKSINPRPGEFYAAAAEHLGRRLQFDRAEQFYKQAIAHAPHLVGPLNGLGILLMRVGKEDEAREVFAKARRIDPYHVRVANMSKVLDHMKDYSKVESPHYVVSFSKGDELIGRYMSEYLERIHPTLVKRFAYEPKQKTKIEIMKTHQWFSGRVVGVPSIGTVGACTGRVVALASPTSMKQNKYNWARVLTHEVVHIITLEQTNFNIPHWYTEALAVLSENMDRPQDWNRLLVERSAASKLFNLDDINHAFVRPKTQDDWQMAYCQSLLYAEYMLERFGATALAKLLDAYSRGLETPAAIQDAFAVDKADFEKGYQSYVQKLVENLGTFKESKETSFADLQRKHSKSPNDADVAAELADAYFGRKRPDQARELAEKALAVNKAHPGALYALAKMEASIGRLPEAVVLLQRAFDSKAPNAKVTELLGSVLMRQKKYQDAARLYDTAHRRDPLRAAWVEGFLLASLKSKDAGVAEETAKVTSALEKLSRMEADNVQVRRRLAEIYSKQKDWKAAERWARETLYVETADLTAHSLLAEALSQQGLHAAAAAEYAIVLEEVEQPNGELILKVAQTYISAGKTAKAKELLESYISNNPSDSKAKELLQKVKGK